MCSSDLCLPGAGADRDQDQAWTREYCTLRPKAIKIVSDWAISYRQFWEESFDKLEMVVNQMKKAEIRDDNKHGE